MLHDKIRTELPSGMPKITSDIHHRRKTMTLGGSLTVLPASNGAKDSVFQRLRSQSGSHGRALGPLSPPAITQCSPPSTDARSTGPSIGATLRKQTAAGTFTRRAAR